MSIKKRLSMKKKANDTLNSVDSHISKRTIESAQLRTFTSTDSFGYQGARDFKDGEKPMIADGKFATLIISGPDIPSEDYVVMSIYYNEYIMSIVVTNLHLKTSKSALLCKNLHHYMKNLHFNISSYYNFV